MAIFLPNLLYILFLGGHFSSTFSSLGERSQPNIILLLADDAGWADFEGHDDLMKTPNIRQLRSEGVFLNQSYVLPMCVPSRAALLTGKHPHTIGAQDVNCFNQNKMAWLDENLTLLPESLRDLGYHTHMVGKWHLGFCHRDVTPLGRGFDSFYGFFLGRHDSYYMHTNGSLSGTSPETYDWRDGNETDWSAKGHYQTDLLNSRAVRIIQDSNSSRPFFLYQSWGAPHGPFQAPQSYQETYCSHITDYDRKIDCSMMAALDKGVGDIVQALKDKGVYNNTVILFLSDNGGPSKNGSSNWPLRGSKKSLFEGGIRSYTVLKAPGLDKVNRVWKGLAHAVDWFPTLLSLAGGNKSEFTDGKNLWPHIRDNTASPREGFLMLNDFWKFNHTLLRYKQWKLMQIIPELSSTSQWSPGFKSGWYPPHQMLNNGSAKRVHYKHTLYNSSTYLLYNLEEDPYEHTNLASNSTGKIQGVIEMLKLELERQLKAYPLQPFPSHFEFSPSFYGKGALTTNWCQPSGLMKRKTSSGSESVHTEIDSGLGLSVYVFAGFFFWII